MEGFKKFTLLNPTDSVTSDGTPVKPKIDDDADVHEMIAKVHDDIEGRYDLDSYDKGVIHHLLCKLQKPTESQYELWDEIVRDYTDPDGFLDVYLASKSFRIERI